MKEERLDHGTPWSYRPLYIATIAALLGSGIVGAAETAPVTLADENGLMRFPNVQVINAPQPAATGRAAPQEGGLRAYIDPETRQLRAPLPEELERDRARAGHQDRNADGRGREIVSRSGAIGVKLDESHDVSAVVRRRPDGALEEFCVVGPDSAQKLLDARMPPEKSLTSGR